MAHLNNETATLTNDQVVATVTPALTEGNTKDAGRVKIGGGTMRFKSVPSNTRDAGRVKVGGGTIQF